MSGYASLDTSRSGSELPKDGPPSISVQLRELELMHTWCTRTYLSAGRPFARLFRDYIGKEALRHDYLLAALFSLTSYHLATDALAENLPIARQHASAGLQYQTEALRGLRNNVAALTSENCSPVLFTSVLVMACAILSPLLPVGTNESTQSTAETFLPLVDYMKAVESIKGLTKPWLAQTSIMDFLDEELESVEVERPLFVDELHHLNETTSSSEKHGIFNKAIDELAKASRKDGEIVPWLANVGPKFLDALRKGESMALAIYMHWGALLDQLHDTWWARFSSKRLVDELSATLRDRGTEWRMISAWCREQVGLHPLVRSGGTPQ